MKKIIIMMTAISLILAGCKTMNKQQKGTVIGAGAGAAAGALIGKGSIWGILAGAAIGGVAGNLIGKKWMRRQKSCSRQYYLLSIVVQLFQ